jgi:hypothetical protein
VALRQRQLSFDRIENKNQEQNSRCQLLASTAHRFLIMEDSQVMRRLILSALLGVAVATNVGCFLPIYSGDPIRRTDQLIFTSEDLRNILLEWERIWFLDQPDHETPYRVHGGVI